MRIRYVYTVTTKEQGIEPSELDRHIDRFKGSIKDEPGEFAASALQMGATIVEVEMHVRKDGESCWQTIYGDPR